MVKPKKHLGQHFLHDTSVVQRCVQLMMEWTHLNWVEVGPGTGVLTQELTKHNPNLEAYEIDVESVAHLAKHLPQVRVHQQDFLSSVWSADETVVVGNFPYNISTQIVFKILEEVEQVPYWVGMFQLEVVERICSKPHSKVYGILSVLTQFYYDVKLEFRVKPGAFNPPPKVQSGVMSAKRREDLPEINKSLFFDIVKSAFGQRRKVLTNSLKKFNLPKEVWVQLRFSKLRPEQMSVEEFVELTGVIESHHGND